MSIYDYIISNEIQGVHMLEKIKDAIADAESILVLAGAGMSVDSNLPTYRGKEGFWNAYPLYKALRKNYASMMSSNGLNQDAHFAWGFFAHQYKIYKNAHPHQGYLNLLKLCAMKKYFFVVTTNVDGLFLKSGYPQIRLHEAHGSIHKLQCNTPCHREAWNIDSLEVDIDYSTMNALDPLPLCPICGVISRPNICLFGDTDENYVWEEAQNSASHFRSWRVKNREKKMVILEIGVGTDGLKRHAVQYLKELPHATLIRVNPDFDTTYPEDVMHIQMGTKDFFDELGYNCSND